MKEEKDKAVKKEGEGKRVHNRYTDEAYLAMTPEEKKKERIRRRKEAKSGAAD